MPLDYTLANYDFEGDSEGFGAHLEAQYQLQQDNVEALDSDVAAQTVALHGHGRIDGLVLSTGSGLSASLSAGKYLAGGRLYELLSAATVALPASVTRHIYLDGAGAFALYATKQTPRPDGTWYVGSATTSGVAVTSVDQSACDEVASLVTLLAQVEALQDAVGIPYTSEVDIAERLDILEAGGVGGGGAATVYWPLLAYSLSDGTTIPQYVTAQIDALRAELTAAIATAIAGVTGTGGTGGTTSAITLNDLAARLSQIVLYLTHVLPDLPAGNVNAATVVDGHSGEGSGADGTDYVDPASDW